MRIIINILCMTTLCTTLLWASVAEAKPKERLPGPYAARVLRVIDGDTFAAEVCVWVGQRNRVNVRLATIDAPERGKAGYQEAKERLTRTLGQSALLYEVRLGSFAGRVIARVVPAKPQDPICPPHSD